MSGTTSSSGEFVGPPIPRPGQNPYDFALLFGLWLRSGGQQAPANSSGVGVAALQGEIDGLGVEIGEAQALAFLSTIFSSQRSRPAPPSSGITFGQAFGAAFFFGA